MTNIYLALYKGRGGDWWDKLTDWAIRTFTRGKYSHCEIAIERHHFESGDRCRPTISYDCYTSSPRDGGVRCKKIDVSHRLNWDLVLLPSHITEAQVLAFYEQTKGAKYDFFGALGVVLGNRQSRSKSYTNSSLLFQNSTDTISL